MLYIHLEVRRESRATSILLPDIALCSPLSAALNEFNNTFTFFDRDNTYSNREKSRIHLCVFLFLCISVSVVVHNESA